MKTTVLIEYGCRKELLIEASNDRKKIKKVVDKRQKMWYSNMAVAKTTKNIDNWTIDNIPENSKQRIIQNRHRKMSNL